MVTELFSSLLSMSLSLLGITFIIVFHEFGHFLFAKLCKVYTPTFSIGIGKVLFSKKIGDTDFCVSAGPIGGYVEIATEKGKGSSVGFNSIPYLAGQSPTSTPRTHKLNRFIKSVREREREG